MNLTLLRHPWIWLGFGLLTLLVRGLFIDIMDVDAAQYASMAMEMGQRGTWLQVLHRGADYLDKPPLLFWVSAISMRWFGLYNWAYKLPSVLGALAGIYAVYRFSELFYPEQAARHAAFILASSFGLLIICNDVRTDTLLLGMTTCAIWQLAEYMYNSTAQKICWRPPFSWGWPCWPKGRSGWCCPLLRWVPRCCFGAIGAICSTGPGWPG